jgi:hypothetical protein
MPSFETIRTSATAALMTAAWMMTFPGPADAQRLAPFTPAHGTFTATLSNNTPLAFGMDAEDATRALGTPLNYVSGRPGNEIYLTIRHGGGSGFFPRNDRLYLQFRNGRLAGWKGDWGSRWMWQ